ncbi:MAG: hypothetical protein ACE5KX_02275 [Acidimicrobiia bacterium]
MSRPPLLQSLATIGFALGGVTSLFAGMAVLATSVSGTPGPLTILFGAALLTTAVSAATLILGGSRRPDD